MAGGNMIRSKATYEPIIGWLAGWHWLAATRTIGHFLGKQAPQPAKESSSKQRESELLAWLRICIIAILGKVSFAYLQL